MDLLAEVEMTAIAIAPVALAALGLIAWLTHGRITAERALAATDRKLVTAEHNAKTHADLLAHEKRRTHALVDALDTMAASAAADPAGAELRMLARYARAIYTDGDDARAVPDRADATAESRVDRDGLLRPGE